MNNCFTALVIDENNEIQSGIRKALCKLGFSVKVTENVESGKGELSTFDYTVVFVSAEEGHFIHWGRNMSPDTKFFVIANWANEINGVEVFHESIDGIIHKPLLFTEIRDAIFEHLG